MQQPSIASDFAFHRTLLAGSSFVVFEGDPPPAIPGPRRSVPTARLRRLAAQVHALGERPLYELLRELVAGRDPVERIERYAELPAEFIAAFGGDKLPALRLIDGDAQ